MVIFLSFIYYTKARFFHLTKLYLKQNQEILVANQLVKNMGVSWRYNIFILFFLSHATAVAGFKNLMDIIISKSIYLTVVLII